MRIFQDQGEALDPSSADNKAKCHHHDEEGCLEKKSRAMAGHWSPGVDIIYVFEKRNNPVVVAVGVVYVRRMANINY